MTERSAASDAFEALLGLHPIIDVALSPDGEQVAYLVDGDIGTVRLQGRSGPVAEPLIGPGLTATALTWSVDGSAVLVAAGSSPSYPDRLVRLDPAAGTASVLARVGGAIEDIVPAGAHVVLRVADPGSHRDGMHLGLPVPAPDPAVQPPENPLRRLVRVAPDTTPQSAESAGPGGTPAGPFGGVEIPLAGYTVWDHDVDPAGRVLAVVSRDPRPAGYYHGELVLTDLAGATPRVLVSSRGQLARPRLAPDGRTAYVVQGRSIVSGQVLQIDLVDGTVRVAPGLDDVTDLGVRDDGTLWFCGWHGTGTEAGTLDAGLQVTSRAVRAGALGGRDGQPTLSVSASGRFVTVGEDPTHPPEILLGSLGDDGHWSPLTGVNAALAGLTAPLTRQPASWTSTDGTRVDGLLLRRADAPARCPLVVITHGGPTWLWANAFAPAEANGLAVPLALAGATVLLPNPRGSSGRGQGYADAIAGHVGHVEAEDVLAGVDALVAAGVADPDRMAVMGLSYGGYLAAWLAARTNVFRAAVVMSGVADWSTFAETSNLGGGFDAAYFPGVNPRTPHGAQQLLAVSPTRHGRALTAPTLVLHGEQDQVTPLGQAHQLTQAWTRAGSVVELVVYPREGHELVEPEHRRDATARVLDWLQRYGVLG